MIAGWRARILAAGYLPQPILDKAPAAGVTLDRQPSGAAQSRPRHFRPRVVPRRDARGGRFRFLLVGGRSVRIGGGKAWQGAGPNRQRTRPSRKTITDSQGRFTLHGGGGDAKTIAVSAPRLDVWAVPAPDSAAAKSPELIVKLPQPGRLAINYDIPGGDAEAALFMDIATFKAFGWNEVWYVREPSVANGGQTLLDNLPPGKYELTRKMPKSQDGRFLCDRRTVTIESGKTTTSEFVRHRGTVVEGRIVGLKKGMFEHERTLGPKGEMAGSREPSAIVTVRSAGATGDLPGDWDLTFYDALVCGADGKFKTERLLPGKYAILAEAYLPEKYGGAFDTGVRLSDFVGRVVVTAPDGGPPPQATIELRPRGEVGEACRDKGGQTRGARRKTARLPPAAASCSRWTKGSSGGKLALTPLPNRRFHWSSGKRPAPFRRSLDDLRFGEMVASVLADLPARPELHASSRAA